MTNGDTKSGSISADGDSSAIPTTTILGAFAAFIILGSGASLAIRFTYGELAPYWSGVLRFGAAALIFWALLLIRRVPLPRGRALFGAALFGFLSVGAAFLFVYYGLTKTQASLYQTTMAIVPLLTLFFAAAHKLEVLRRRGVFGGILAVAGIAIAVSGSLSAGVEVSLPHILAILAAAACFAEAGIVAKLFPRNHPYATNAVGMTVGVIMLAAASLIRGETWTLPSSAETWLAMLYIILGATVGGFLVYLFLLKRWTASGTSYGFVLIPIGTVVLASLLTDETISLIFLVGAAVVLAGVYVGAIMPAKKPAQEVAEKPAIPEEIEPDAENIQVRPGLPTCV
ncbi:MAG TPA: EamA family transporter [Anaerolineae bacterium]|nr:EamA family transporter [Anaerolineae bacterium]